MRGALWAALERDSESTARTVLAQGLPFGPLAAIAGAYSHGLEVGLALAVHHPELGRRLLEVIEEEVHGEHRAQAVAERDRFELEYVAAGS